MELHAATDVCLMPSRDEPFGYVDIEFGLYGALCVGFLVGGLGKMPGVYARATTYNRRFLTQQLKVRVRNKVYIPTTQYIRVGLVEFWKSSKGGENKIVFTNKKIRDTF